MKRRTCLDAACPESALPSLQRPVPGVFRSPFTCLAALLSLSLLFASCGVKTHPYPESSTLPAKVVDLRQEQDSRNRLRLIWTAPTLNMAGRPLRVLSHFEVWGADYESGVFCDGCPSNYRKLGEVHLQPPPPGLAINEGPYYWGAELMPGRVYRYRVAGFSVRGAAHPEAWTEITVHADPPPGGLEGFSAQADDLSVRLGFRPGGTDEILEVQRCEGAGPWRRLDFSGSGYVDLDVAYGKTYSYRGRRVLRSGGSSIPGPWSREITVSVDDLLPPRPVGYLDAALGAEGVILRWESLSEVPGLAGYRVYRREGPDGEFVRLGGLHTTNTYLDREAPTVQDLRYMVTAVDDSPRANESLGSPEAGIFLDREEPPEEKPDLRDLGL